jgi:DNA-binding beta-propeller fold protein YncE
MARGATSSALLYVSDSGKDEVDVFSFPGGKRVGSLLGFDVPQGECVDQTGDVWITNQSGNTIVEYAHGGTKPIATLKDTGEYPDSCAVDPKSGDLAVTNGFSSSGGGSVAIYTGASGSPTKYTDSSITEYSFVAYDDSGDLFVDGVGSDGGFALAKLPKGKTTFKNLTLDRVKYPGALAWDNSELAVGDANPFKQGLLIYRLAGTKVSGHTQLEDSCGSLGDFTISDGSLVAIDPSCATAGVYKYPAGGAATTSIKLSRHGAAVGVVVSP